MSIPLPPLPDIVNPITDADLDRIADAVPVDDIGVHITTWHRRFARAVLSAAPVVREPLSEPVQRLMRFAGKKRNEVSNPCLTAREAIVIADWMQAHGIGGGGK